MAVQEKVGGASGFHQLTSREKLAPIFFSREVHLCLFRNWGVGASDFHQRHAIVISFRNPIAVIDCPNNNSF